MTDHLIKERYNALFPAFDERIRRIYLAAEAKVLGDGGASKVVKATGTSYRTIRTGKIELEALSESNILDDKRVRKPGGGRKQAIVLDKRIKHSLESLIEPSTRGDPESPLRWTCKSLRNIAAELTEKGHKVSRNIISNLLKDMGYSLQANKKRFEGSNHIDRDAQFRYINKKVIDRQSAGDPVISVDTKKKELVGNFKNNGQELAPKGSPIEVNAYDFPSLAEGKASPYGVYDVTKNVASVNVGISADTAEFAVESIRQWWKKMGSASYSDAKSLLITADSGGSNGYRIKLWKSELQKLANEINIPISVSHFPPGTSKWNKIEHRLFSYITLNWRGKPLVSFETIVNLIGSTKTKNGLFVKSQLDTKEYKKGIKISDKEMKLLNWEKDDFHGEWNYTIAPSNTP